MRFFWAALAILVVGLEAGGWTQDSPPAETPATQQGSSSASPEAGQDSSAPAVVNPVPPAAQKKTATKKRRLRRKIQPPSGKTVVRNGGARDQSVELSPGVSQDQETHNRENTSQLLATTNANLKSVEGRQLSDSQQSMLDQIHAYLRQAKTAADAGDFTRAHTLAYKAHLLSDELAKK